MEVARERPDSEALYRGGGVLLEDAFGMPCFSLIGTALFLPNPHPYPHFFPPADLSFTVEPEMVLLRLRGAPGVTSRAESGLYSGTSKDSVSEEKVSFSAREVRVAVGE